MHSMGRHSPSRVRNHHDVVIGLILFLGFCYSAFMVNTVSTKFIRKNYTIDTAVRGQPVAEVVTAQSSTLNEEEIGHRAQSILLGAFLADAASMGLHWIYDTDKIKDLVRTRAQSAVPEFYDPPSSPFYSYTTGSQSPYGDEILPLLQHLAEYQDLKPMQFTADSYAFNSKYTGYLNKVLKQFDSNFAEGERWPNAAVGTNHDADGLVKVPVIVARYGGTSKLVQNLRLAIRVHQTDPIAESVSIAAGLVLEKLMLGSTIPAAITSTLEDDEVSSDVKKAMEDVVALHKTGASISSAIERFGMQCSLPGVFQGALFTLLSTMEYVDAVRENILAGGDSCSRGIYIGAAIAAVQGQSVIPEEWKTKVTKLAELKKLIDELVQNRASEKGAER